MKNIEHPPIILTERLDEIVSFTAVANMRSRAVMKRIGMHQESKGDFDHPKLPEGHPLRRHVLYRINYQNWKNTKDPRELQ